MPNTNIPLGHTKTAREVEMMLMPLPPHLLACPLLLLLFSAQQQQQHYFSPLFLSHPKQH
jgi:hypothetical protein